MNDSNIIEVDIFQIDKKNISSVNVEINRIIINLNSGLDSIYLPKTKEVCKQLLDTEVL